MSALLAGVGACSSDDGSSTTGESVGSAGRSQASGGTASDDGGTTSADGGTRTDSGSGGTAGNPAPAGRVPMFVATGHLGRSLISCDGGKTWIADRSFDREGDAHVCGEAAPTRCNTDGYGCQVTRYNRSTETWECDVSVDSCDCTHHPGSSQGVAYGDGTWVAAWGWGRVPSVRRTHDGVVWETVRDGMDDGEPFDVKTYTGVAHGQGLFLLGDRSVARSEDGGATWTEGGFADLRDQQVWPDDPQKVINAREFGYADVDGGVFVLTGSSRRSRVHDGLSCAKVIADGTGCQLADATCEDTGDGCKETAPTQDLMVSRDGGDSWTRPEPLPRECGNGAILGGNGAVLVAMDDGTVCVSTDAGGSFTTTQLGGPLRGNPIFDGDRFVAFTDVGVTTSDDGQTWASPTPYTQAPERLGPVAYDPERRVFVSIHAAWKQWYGDDARAYRSEDGLAWETLTPPAYPGGHAIQDIEFGYGVPHAEGCAL